MKKVFKVIRIIVWVLLGLYGLLYLSLNTPFVQRKISRVASETLSEKLGVKVEIGKVSYSLFNRFVARDLFLQDQRGDTLFHAKKMGVNINLWALTNHKVKINTAYLYGFQFNLSKADRNSPTNLQFVIDAFAKKDTVPKKSFIEEIELKTLILRKGSFCYDLRSEQPKASGFDINHIRVDDISLNFAIRKISKGMIDLAINRLGLKEKSGLQVDKITAELVSDENQATLKAFRINLPNTILNFSSLKVDYSKVTKDRPFADYAYCEARLAPSIISVSDLQGLVPALGRIKAKTQIQFAASGTINDLRLQQLSLQSEDKLNLMCRGEIQGISNPKLATIGGYVDDCSVSTDILQPFFLELLPKSSIVQEIIRNAGDVRFTGDIQGLLSDFKAKGNLNTALGSLNIDSRLKNDTIRRQLKLSGGAETRQFRLGSLCKATSEFGRVDLKINLDGVFQPKTTPDLHVKGAVRNLDYKMTRFDEIVLDVAMNRNGYKGKIMLDDDNGRIDLTAHYETSRNTHDGKLNIAVDHFNLEQLQLNALKGLKEVTFALDATAKGSNIDDIVGSVLLQNLALQGEKNKLRMEEMRITSEKTNGISNIFIQSPFITAKVEGVVNWTMLPKDIKHLLSIYLPTLANEPLALQPELHNDFMFRASINNTSELTTILNLPFNVEETAVLSGMIHKQQKQLSLNVDAPLVKVGTQTFQKSKIKISNDGGVIASVEAVSEIASKQGEPIRLNIRSKAAMDIISTQLAWDIHNKVNFQGTLDSNCTFIRNESEPLEVGLFLLPSQISINDTIWNFEKSNIQFRPKHIIINHLGLISADQHLKIDGDIAENPSDSLKLELKNISLDFIFDVLNIGGIHLGGRASGNFVGKTLFKEMNLSTHNLNVKNFSVNRAIVGDLKATSHWDHLAKGVIINGKILSPEQKITTAQGGIYIPQDSISMEFGAQSLNIAFLDKYLGTILTDMQGKASGSVRLFGKFSALKLSGAASLENLSFGIDYLKTRFYVQDSILLTPRRITFKNMRISDGKAGTGIFSGYLSHRSFSNIRFDMNATVQNMTVLSTDQHDNPLFYGTIYGTGNASLSGTDQEIDIDVNMQSQPNSKFTFVLSNNKTAGESNFITFKEKNIRIDSTAIEGRSTIATAAAPTSKLNMNLNLDVNRNVGISLIMDPNSGDMIKGVGSGNINIELAGNEDVKMYGRYTIENGSYNFSFQRIFNKTFTLEQGSTVTFNGNPLDADMNVKAMYSVSANLLDLDNSFSDVARSTVPVQCLLNIQGNIDRPTLGFDLNLPSNTEDINRRVKNLIGTEDMMNRQIIYLMMLGRFYTLGNVSTDVGNTNELGSLALSSTLSSQLNSLVRQFSSNWDVGTNLRWDDTGSDFEVTFSTQLNDRLKLQGNVGVQNDSKTNQTFIGDFLAEYSLNKAGTLFLKAYNKTNEKNYYEKSSLTTQGIGILFRKSFDSFNQMFQKSDAVFERKKKNEPKDSIK